MLYEIDKNIFTFVTCNFIWLYFEAGWVEPVNNFDLEPYLGKWYEIARLDHSFERGLSNVTAEYQVREGGGVKVINRGYSEEERQWSEAEGKAYFVEDKTVGHLKVSFFGPIYSSYIVFELGENYDYAFVSGYNTTICGYCLERLTLMRK